jgi:uncharacterized membrane protein YphA (DoxX/SURF4 family)
MESSTIEDLRRWVRANRDLVFEMLRVYLGFALFVRGISLIAQLDHLIEMVKATQAFGTVVIAHYVIMAHLAGGLLLCVGFLTRMAALIQVPVLLGAVFLVHRSQGFFTAAQTLEYSILVLFLLVLYSVAGAGRLSVDHVLAQKLAEEQPLARSSA